MTLSLTQTKPFQSPSVASLLEQATELLQEAAEDHIGDVSPSVYETARLVADVPWLEGHTDRVRFLLATQRADGGWGPPNHYALVPTLGAVRALLTCLLRGSVPGGPSGGGQEDLLQTAERGIRSLAEQLFAPDDSKGRPDMIAVELVVPSLVLDIRDLLNRLGTGPYPRLLQGVDMVTFPAGLGPEILLALRSAAHAGRPVPQRFWFSWEAVGLSAADAPYVHPVGGAVGISPAATAAWLGPEPPPHRNQSREYLESLQRRRDGAVTAGGAPATFYERAWVLGALATSGVPCAVPPALLDSLENGLSADGAPAAPGLPPDADDTAAVLLALAAYGRTHRPDALMGFYTGDHFACFPSERTASTSTNAHALEALAYHTARHPDDRAHYGSAMRRTADWLLACQLPEGGWEDKWHASPYYATACCVLALAADDRSAARAALRRAAEWVLSEQRTNGGWGRWESTVEETAYAVRILMHTGSLLPSRQAWISALSRAFPLLEDPPASMESPPPLWHGKDLYAPYRIIRAMRLAALQDLHAP